MVRFFLIRIGEAIAVLLLVTLGTAGLVNLIPGLPVMLMLSEFATPLVLTSTLLFQRVLRTGLVSALHEDYVLAARVRGMPAPAIDFSTGTVMTCFGG